MKLNPRWKNFFTATTLLS